MQLSAKGTGTGYTLTPLEDRRTRLINLQASTSTMRKAPSNGTMPTRREEAASIRFSILAHQAPPVVVEAQLAAFLDQRRRDLALLQPQALMTMTMIARKEAAQPSFLGAQDTPLHHRQGDPGKITTVSLRRWVWANFANKCHRTPGETPGDQLLR